MLLVTCDTAICLPAIVAKFGEEYRNRIQAFKSNAVCSWPSDANGPTICVKVPRIWIFSCLECSDGGGRLTKWGINFQLNFPLKVFEGAAASWTERERERERESRHERHEAAKSTLQGIASFVIETSRGARQLFSKFIVLFGPSWLHFANWRKKLCMKGSSRKHNTLYQ